jgi:hypothetical protein
MPGSSWLRGSGFQAVATATEHEFTRRPAAAFLVFFPRPTGARIIPPDLGGISLRARKSQRITAPVLAATSSNEGKYAHYRRSSSLPSVFGGHDHLRCIQKVVVQQMSEG